MLIRLPDGSLLNVDQVQKIIPMPDRVMIETVISSTRVTAVHDIVACQARSLDEAKKIVDQLADQILQGAPIIRVPKPQDSDVDTDLEPPAKLAERA